MMLKEKIMLKKTQYNEAKIRLRNSYTFMNKSVAREGQVVFFGDSITEFLSAGDWYGEYSVKNGKEVYNRGIGGDTTNRLFERTRDNVTCIKPCAVVLLIGTNDIGLGFDSDFISNNIEKTLILLKADCPDCRIILQAIYPVIEGKAEKRTNRAILDANKKIKALAEKYKTEYLDLTYILSDKNGNLRQEYTYDGLHLSAAGYEVTTREITAYLP